MTSKRPRPRASRPPPRAATRPRWTRPGWLVVGGFLILSLIATVTLFAASRTGGNGPGKAVEITLSPDASPGDIADILASAGVVASATRFAIYLRVFADASAIKPGAHYVPDDLAAEELVAVLSRTANARREKVTFPEGWTRFDMARRLAERRIVAPRRFLSATTDKALLAELQIPADSAEGYLFPATYVLPLDSDPRDIVRRLKQELDSRMAKLKTTHPEAPGAAARELGWSLHQAITLASLVEKEAVVDDERATVASAFYNRFRDPTFLPKPPRLQSDPSSAYGCLVRGESIPSCAGFTGRITPEMNHDPANPYSTYVNAGLPPGPIANPGEKSLSAAMAPADTRFLYFVAKGGGRHTFSATLAEHNAAVKHLKELRHAP